jgi:hypothetical protein
VWYTEDACQALSLLVWLVSDKAVAHRKFGLGGLWWTMFGTQPPLFPQTKASWLQAIHLKKKKKATLPN